MHRLLLAVLTCLTATLMGAGGAWAHERETNNGVTVTLHVDPNDQPVTGQPATLVIESVESQAAFSWSTCTCTLVISDSSGATLLKGPAMERTAFTFPNTGAYQIVFAGRVLKTTKTLVKKRVRKVVKKKVTFVLKTSTITSTSWVTFSIPFALRADPAS